MVTGVKEFSWSHSGVVTGHSEECLVPSMLLLQYMFPHRGPSERFYYDSCRYNFDHEVESKGSSV